MGEKKIRVAPHSKESEMMVLGCMLSSINSMNIAADSLDERDFYFTEHQIIFGVLKGAYRQDKPADVHLACEELKRIDKLDSVGGASYVTTLAQYAGTSAYIEEYVDIVKSKSILRKMIQAAQIVEKNALEEPQDVYGALDDAQGLFFKISQTANSGAGILIAELLSGVKASSQAPFLKELQERQESFRQKGPGEPKITGIPTHYIDLDKMIDGFNDSNLMILAGRPAMGKTALALNIAENICFKNHLPVGIFSLEMTAEQLMQRMICSQAEVEAEKIRTGSLSGVEFQRIVAAVGEMQKHTMVIDDQPGLKITDLRARARRMRESYGIRFLAVDYLQLIAGSGSARTMESRQNEISEISRMLKTLARELNIPVLCMSQLSRKVEDRAGHRPMMSDLRESGCLSGDTSIQNAETGQFYSIKELAEREQQIPFFVFGIDKNNKIGKYRMLKAFYSGKKVVYNLKTRTGREIKASANHPFLKLEGWTRLDQLKKGDRIGLPRHLKPASPLHTHNKGYRSMHHVHVQGSENQIRFLNRTPARLLNFLDSEESLSQIFCSAAAGAEGDSQGLSSSLWQKKGGQDFPESEEFKSRSGVNSAGKRGNQKETFLHNLSQIQTNPNTDIIPKEAWKLCISPVKEEKKLGWREFCQKLNMSYCGSTLFKHGISRKRMSRIAQILDSQALLELANSDVYWDEIISITEIGEEEVYDATIEEVHNFVANDIIVHNSIEQDSDIVMLMLRREYYDPNDKPGMAELIVAKNRHGGVGNINLSFIKELGQFRNYTPIQVEVPEDSFANI